MKTNLCVMFGGVSVEHEVAVISGVQAMMSLDRDKYNVIPVYITKSGEFYCGEKLTDIEAFKDIPALLKECSKVSFVKNAEGVELLFEKKGNYKAKTSQKVDFVLPVVHGTNCEDGSLQGFLELLGVPYGESDVFSSALGMDKVLFKNVMQGNGLPVLPCIWFYFRDWIDNRDALIERIEKEIGYPVIVKPANLGSSVGISKIKNRDELLEKVALAGSFAPKILIERAVEGLREINCSVLGDAYECQTSVCEEPVMQDDILSFGDKYERSEGSKGMSGLSRIIPAEIVNEKTEEICEIAKKAFKALGCCGVVRIDFIIDTQNNDTVYINEINTIPGSLSFYLWEPAGMPYKELLDNIIRLGQKRAREKNNLMFTHETNILSKGGFGAKGTKK